MKNKRSPIPRSVRAWLLLLGFVIGSFSGILALVFDLGAWVALVILSLVSMLVIDYFYSETIEKWLPPKQLNPFKRKKENKK